MCKSRSALALSFWTKFCFFLLLVATTNKWLRFTTDFLASLHRNSSPLARSRQKKVAKSPQAATTSNIERLLNSNVAKERLISLKLSTDAKNEAKYGAATANKDVNSIDDKVHEMEGTRKLIPSSPLSFDSSKASSP